MKIPDRWLDYCKIGSRIAGTPFISFKTPLQCFNGQQEEHPPENISDKEQFSPTDVCEEIIKQNHSLKVVIDLTNTFKYYNGQQEFAKRNGVYYEKIKCQGQQIPNDQVFNRFKTIVNNFLMRHGCVGQEVIGVHCTHGLNRTGYLVCRYMIDWLGFQPNQAIDAFNTARGHTMERQNYLDDLKRRKASNRFEKLHQGLPMENGPPSIPGNTWLPSPMFQNPPMERHFSDNRWWDHDQHHQQRLQQQQMRDFRRGPDYQDDRPTDRHDFNIRGRFNDMNRPPSFRRRDQYSWGKDNRSDFNHGGANRDRSYPSKWRTNPY